jgi:polyhydroxyalkanoate synthesis regulator phasin
MKKIVITALAFGLLIGMGSSGPAQAGEIDILVDKLVEKGVISPVEAQIVVDETKHEVSKEIAEAKHKTLPKWLQTFKLKGDLRLRYQNERRKGSANSGEGLHRGRIRFRLGGEAKVTDKVKVGFRFATGSLADPRSTNQTMDDTFEKRSFNLDMAYAQWDFADWLTFVGGKMPLKKMVWAPSDLVWDTDITPEGVAANLTHTFHPQFDVFFNSGVYFMDFDRNTTNFGRHPNMWVLQPGAIWTPMDGVTVKGGLAYYYTAKVKDHTLANSSGTNSTVNNELAFKHNSVNPAVEIGIKKPFDAFNLPDYANVPYLAGFGEYIHNTDPSDDDDGFLVGAKIGHKKVKKKGQWQAKYNYRRLERDAFLDTFPDSDAYGGLTHIRGHEVALKYAFKKNWILGLDYYRTKVIDQDATRENLFQADCIFKF